MKDRDDTWLYGPFHPHPSRASSTIFSARHPLSTLHHSRTKKPILKTPSLKASLLRGSLSSQDLVIRHHSKASRTKKNVKFHREVEQFIAVQATNDDDRPGHIRWTRSYQSSFEYGGLVSQSKTKPYSSTPRSPHRRHSDGDKKSKAGGTVKKLPSTTLKQEIDAETRRTSGAALPHPMKQQQPFTSSLSEWTLLGDGTDDEEDWLSPAFAANNSTTHPAPQESYSPTPREMRRNESEVRSNLIHETESGSNLNNRIKAALLANDFITCDDDYDYELGPSLPSDMGSYTPGLTSEHSPDLTLPLSTLVSSPNPSLSSTSDITDTCTSPSSSQPETEPATEEERSQETEKEDAFIKIYDFENENEEGDIGCARKIPLIHHLKQALVDRMIEEFYMDPEEEDSRSESKHRMRRAIMTI